MLLEICVEDAAGIEAAAAGGADRIELCTALCVGGLTPPQSLMRLASTYPLPVRALCRPRAGDFGYDSIELALMQADVVAAINCGLEGVVIGAGDENGLDANALAETVAAARAAGAAQGRRVGLTLHRVFDTTDDLFRSLELAVNLGFDTILTSGGKPKAQDAGAVLAALVDRAAGRIAILAGSGIDPAAVPILASNGIRNFHASCREANDQACSSRLIELGFADQDCIRTNAGNVSKLRAAILQTLEGGSI
ncbi:CutC family protein [Novosphingobium sp. Rr 2-17]|uniref:copper homeostasis protein CutC n=1 Tax=Novosphingobium sp. Rr 2-17 TaxID=555793 RepID=UPI0002697EE2|nr:copper homeostasis protein CutC [Novosphingobium sp. Rr 2-17]EIZ78359.1 CutC family protein [Novosphingobium sp. Rr 2-17]